MATKRRGLQNEFGHARGATASQGAPLLLSKASRSHGARKGGVPC